MANVGKWCWLGMIVFLCIGCSDDDSGSANNGNSNTADTGNGGGADIAEAEGDTTGGSGTDSTGATEDTGTGGEDVLAPEGLLADGLWFTAVSVEPLGGFVLPLQLDITSTNNGDGSGKLTNVSIRAVGSDGTSTSDVLGTIETVDVAVDGTFITPLIEVTLPGQYTITGSDVVVAFQFDGTIQESTFVCGKVTGTVITLNLDLGDKTTFAATPWGQQASPPVVSCDSGNIEELPHIESCPDIVAGLNSDFNTAKLSRSFRVVLPTDYSTDKKWPVVFLFHGLGSSVTDILDDTKMDEYVDKYGFILIIPESTQGPVEWVQLDNKEQNPDLIFFDDLVSCSIEKLSVDPDRVHVSGMSAGGLFTVFLSVMRSSVIASSAPFSGGLIIEPPAIGHKLPMLVTWGGPTDGSTGQNFDTLAMELIEFLRTNDHFVAQCNHGTGHKWPDEMTQVAVEFLMSHPMGVAPEPYAGGLPDSTPQYCSIAE